MLHVCMCMGSPRQSTSGLMGMCLCALVLSWVIVAFLTFIFLTVLHCLCLYICCSHLYIHFIPFLIIFIRTFHHHLSPHLIYTVWVFCLTIHWWRWLCSRRNVSLWRVWASAYQMIKNRTCMQTSADGPCASSTPHFTGTRLLPPDGWHGNSICGAVTFCRCILQTRQEVTSYDTSVCCRQRVHRHM